MRSPHGRLATPPPRSAFAGRAPGDIAKRELLDALRAAFITPLEPEDVFALSRGIDRILDFARDLVAEAEVLDQDSRRADRRDGGAYAAAAVRRLDEAIAVLRQR